MHPTSPLPIHPTTVAAPQKEAAVLARLEEELAGIKRRQGELKVVLYARFGKSINLED